MIQVDKKYLEEQVKILIEQASNSKGQQSVASKALDDMLDKKLQQGVIQSKQEGFDYMELLLSILIGSEVSREAIFNSGAETYKYGWGHASYINSSINKFKNIDSVSASLLPFLEVGKTEDEYEFKLKWKEQVFTSFYRVCDQYSKLMLPLIKSRNKKKLASTYQDFCNAIRDDVLENYNVSNAEKWFSWALGGKTSQEKFGRFFNERQLDPEDKDAENYAEYLITSSLRSVTKDTASFAYFLEEIIMNSHKVLGTRGKLPNDRKVSKLVDLPRLIQQLKQSEGQNLPQMFGSLSHMNYLKQSNNFLYILVAILDIVLSLAFTYSLIYGMVYTAGLGVAAVPWAAGAKVAAQQAMKRGFVNAAVRSVNKGKRISDLIQLGKLPLKAQLVVNVGFTSYLMTDSLQFKLDRMDQLHKLYWQIYNNKEYSVWDLYSAPLFGVKAKQVAVGLYDLVTGSEPTSAKPTKENLKTAKLSKEHKNQLLSLILNGRNTVLPVNPITGKFKDLWSFVDVSSGIVGLYSEIYGIVQRSNEKFSDYIESIGGDPVMLNTEIEKLNTSTNKGDSFSAKVKQSYTKGNQQEATRILDSMRRYVNFVIDGAEEVEKQRQAMQVGQQILNKDLVSVKQQKNKKQEFIEKTTENLGIQAYMKSPNTPAGSGVVQTTPIKQPEASTGETFLIAGDSIAVGFIRNGGQALGPNAAIGGIHTWQILRRIRTALSKLQEQKESKKTIILSAGTNDAIAYAMGLLKNPDSGVPFAPETTSNELDQIVSLVKSKGYNIRIRQLGPLDYKGTVKKIDPVKYKEFCSKVNAHMATKGYSTFPITTQMHSDGIHHTDKGYAEAVKYLKGTSDKASSLSVQKASVPKKNVAKNLSAGNVLFVGDSITVGMGVFGAKLDNATYTSGKYKGRKNQTRISGVSTAKWGWSTKKIYDELVEYFNKNTVSENLLKEQNEKIMIVSAGTNDAIGYVRGGPFTAKTAAATLQKIVDLGKKNGYTPKVMPLLPYTGPEINKVIIGDANGGRFNKERWDKYADEFNQSSVVKQHGFNNSGVKMAGDGIHPSIAGYGQLFKNAMGGTAFTGIPTTATAAVTALKPTTLPKGAQKYYPLFKKYSEKYNVDVALMMGICHRESNFRPNRVSHTKDYGLMQINRGNWKYYGITKDNVFDPETNIKTGILFFSQVRNRDMPKLFRQRKSIIKWEDLSEEEKDRFALYGYNWGPWGLFYHRKPHKYKDVNKFFANMSKYYKNYSYVDKKTGERKYIPLEDYSLKAINFAKKYGYGGSAVTTATKADNSLNKALQTGKAPTAGAASGDSQSEPVAVASVERFEDIIEQIEKLTTLNDIIVHYVGAYGVSKGKVTSNVIGLENKLKRMNDQNLESYTSSKFKELKRNVHESYRSMFRTIYEREKASDEQKANETMAFLHRPRIVVGVETDRLLYTQIDDFTLSYELGKPYGNQIGVIPENWVFFNPERFGNSLGMTELRRIIIQNKDTVLKYAEKTRSLGPGMYGNRDLGEEQKRTYIRYFNTLSAIYSMAEDALKPGGSNIRKAWFMDNFASTLYLL